MPAESWADLLANAGDAAQSREALDAGDYDVVVTKAEVAFSKAGNKMYKLTLKVESGPHANRTLWKELVVAQSSGGLGAFFSQMRALTLDAKFFASNPDDEIITDNLVGKRASANVIKDDSYDGTPRNKVKWLNAPKGPAPVGGPINGPAASVPSPAAASAGVPSGAPAVSPPSGGPAGAPPVSAPPPADPWANSAPPSMGGLGTEAEPF